MRFDRFATASGWRRRGIIALILAFALVGLASGARAQRLTDAGHPEGKWEVLDRCRLLTNAPMDGDSFRLAHRDREYGVRLYFVDAPEQDTTFPERIQDQAAYFGLAREEVPGVGELAARFTRERLAGREFTVQTRWQNALGRGQVARFYCVVLVDGKNLAEELVAHGLARVHGLKANLPDGTRSATVVNRLKNLELTAREQRLGVWDERKFPRRPDTSAAAAPVAKRMPTAPAPLPDLNRASDEELQQLPGVGPKLAGRIVAHRPYRKVDDLDAVPGIGPKLVARLKPLVRVEPETP